MMQREYKLLQQAIPDSDLVPDFSDPQSFEQKSWCSLWEEVALRRLKSKYEDMQVENVLANRLKA